MQDFRYPNAKQGEIVNFRINALAVIFNNQIAVVNRKPKFVGVIGGSDEIIIVKVMNNRAQILPP